MNTLPPCYRCHKQSCECVAVLCAARNSAYGQIPGVAIYDIAKDARTFPGGMPIVAHPPCRLWSKYMRQWAKPEDADAERALGLWCCKQLRQWGGVLEQPAHSLLFAAADFPVPSTRQEEGDVWTAEVWQAWWGYPTKKATWLAFCGVPRNAVDFPFKLHAKGSDRRTFEHMSHRQRSETVPAFAEWLVSKARIAIGRLPQEVLF